MMCAQCCAVCMEWTDLICSDSTQIGDCPGIGFSNSDIDTVMIVLYPEKV